MHFGQSPGTSSYGLGQTSGEEVHTLVVAEIPAHSHLAMGNGPAAQVSPAGAVWADPGSFAAYHPAAGETMAADALGSAGADQAHHNLQPFLTVNFAIALQGSFPSRS